MKVILSVLGALLIGSSLYSQNVLIRKVELAGEQIIVHYDLEDSNPQNEYKLDLYASKDNFAVPLSKVSGDIGGEVKPGTNKKVAWSVREEIGNYKGRIALEVRGKVYVPFAKLQNSVAKSYKRGKSYSINWKSGNTNPVHLELYKGGQRIAGDMNIPNNGGHTFYIPPSAKSGGDYRIKMTDSKNTDDIVYSPIFKVKPKLPLLLKIAPVLAIGGAAAALAGGSKGETAIELPPLPSN